MPCAASTRAGLELRARLADRHQAQGFLVHGKCRYLLCRRIIECADHDGPEIERDRLQVDVLSGGNGPTNYELGACTRLVPSGIVLGVDNEYNSWIVRRSNLRVALACTMWHGFALAQGQVQTGLNS
jgi:hypothetical protein